MNSDFNLSQHISNGIENIIKGILKATLKNPKESAFIVKHSLSIKKAKKIRDSYEKKGEHIPAFLIASITSYCNLFCKGCYARANNSCGGCFQKEQMSSQRWESVFKEAKDLGISFILLAGGEPFLRRDVIEKAAKVKEVLFPIFTNGTMLQDETLNFLDKHRNLVPILSIEGDKNQTDNRRGTGAYDILMSAMDNLNEKGILYGASVTVTTENVRSVTSDDFFDTLHSKGCKVFVFVEYVPVSEETKNLAPTDIEREILSSGQQKLREQHEDAIFISFPGDEKYSGGCLAAGRGFFHINVDGSAEPCPFSPFSDTNVKNLPLLEVLKSPLFQKLNETGMLLGEHDGGCLLFQKENEVKGFLDNSIKEV